MGEAAELVGARTLASAVVLCLASLAAGAAPSASPASQGTIVTPGSQIQVDVGTAWPENLSRGYFPIRVELENGDGRAHRVTLVAEVDTDGPGNRLTRSVELAPGEGTTFDLLAPAFGGGAGPFGFVGWFGGTETYMVRVVVDGKGESYVGSVGSFGSVGHALHPVLVLASATPTEGALAAWTEWLDRNVVTTPVGGTPVPDVSVAAQLSSSAPAQYAAYTSLDLVVLEADGGERPTTAVLDALAAYARLGGVVAIVGRDARNLVEETPALEAWTEERFFLDGGEFETYAVGFGLLALEDGDVLEDGRRFRELRGLFEDHPKPTIALQDSGTRWVPEIPGFGELPYRSLTLALVLFAILIGPVNFLVLKAGGRQVLLLVTIPAIALVATLGVLGYGLLHAGLDVKSASFSLSVLDQREHRAATLELRSFYAGLTPGPGLAPEAGTSLHPQVLDVMTRRSLGFRSEEGLLRGDYLPVRWPAQQTILGERAARGRLQLAREGAALRAENGLGAALELLYVRDGAGREHVAPDGVAAGATAELESAVDLWLADYDATATGAAATVIPGAATPRNRLTRLFQVLGTDSGAQYFYGGLELQAAEKRTLVELLREHLPPGSYAALVTDPILCDPLGLEARELVGRHWVIGILGPEDER